MHKQVHVSLFEINYLERNNLHFLHEKQINCDFSVSNQVRPFLVVIGRI
jgi:hypothetical protein